MKNFNQSSLSTLIGLMCLLVLSSCQKDTLSSDSEIKNSEIALDNERILNALCNENYECRDQVTIANGRILFDECMSFHKEDFLHNLDVMEAGQNNEPTVVQLEHPTKPGEMIDAKIENVNYYDESGELSIENRQTILAQYNGTASSAYVGYITYYILPSAGTCSGGYTSAIVDAANYWNSISGCKVRFVRVYSQSSAELTIGCHNDPLFQTPGLEWLANPSGNAQADFPGLHDRVPGEYISINSVGSHPNKKGRMIHEMGHILGLGHTGGGPGPTYQIAYSPQNDANSIMNSSVSGNTMSNDDKRVVRRIWPTSLTRPAGLHAQRVNSSNVRISFINPGTTILPYDHFYVAHWYNGSYTWSFWPQQGNYQGYHNFLFPKNYSAGWNYFYVLPASHNNEVFGPGSGWVGVYM